MRRLLALLTVVLVLAAINWRILGSERVLREGEMFYLELAPVDPRSLLQGDYMALNYAVANAMREWPGQQQAEGWVMLKLGADRVAREPQPVSGPGQVPADHVVLRYQRDGWRIRVGSDAWFFEEGQGARFERARYGLFRTDGEHALLTALVDQAFQPL